MINWVSLNTIFSPCSQELSGYFSTKFHFLSRFKHSGVLLLTNGLFYGLQNLIFIHTCICIGERNKLILNDKKNDTYMQNCAKGYWFDE